ncbi:hypothetical protein J6590_001127 [Homalodisca vitripennis]|nr:hypothetical protein J6590_001127 [Homalodisca vitripennis]
MGDVNAKKHTLTQMGDQWVKGDFRATFRWVHELLAQDRSAVTHPSIGHARRIMSTQSVWNICLFHDHGRCDSNPPPLNHLCLMSPRTNDVLCFCPEPNGARAALRAAARPVAYRTRVVFRVSWTVEALRNPRRSSLTRSNTWLPLSCVDKRPNNTSIWSRSLNFLHFMIILIHGYSDSKWPNTQIAERDECQTVASSAGNPTALKDKQPKLFFGEDDQPPWVRRVKYCKSEVCDHKSVCAGRKSAGRRESGSLLNGVPVSGPGRSTTLPDTRASFLPDIRCFLARICVECRARNLDPSVLLTRLRFQSYDRRMFVRVTLGHTQGISVQYNRPERVRIIKRENERSFSRTITPWNMSHFPPEPRDHDQWCQSLRAE